MSAGLTLSIQGLRGTGSVGPGAQPQARVMGCSQLPEFPALPCTQQLGPQSFHEDGVGTNGL